jgi:hypothetical protein
VTVAPKYENVAQASLQENQAAALKVAGGGSGFNSRAKSISFEISGSPANKFLQI